MSNIYDKASLVLIPSGTKTSKVYSQKPVSGDGDFTFSRSTAATRVNADGNIEKETQNLLLQSNTFDTTWGATAGTMTGGQADKDGGTSAWKFEATGSGQSRFNQTISVSGVNTISMYAKAGTANFLCLYIIGSGDPRAFFNLSTGAVGSTGSNIDANIEDVGNGWYRCSLTFDRTSSTLWCFVSNTDGNFNSAIGDNIYIQDAQLEQGLVARDYIETTTTAVEGGITDNVPRLDYQGSCPALLLEPQRTNDIQQSEYIKSGVAGYTIVDATITTNSTTSPEGLQNATLFECIASNDGFYNFTTGSAKSVGDKITLSLFAKIKSGSSTNIIKMGYGGVAVGGDRLSRFNISTGTITYSHPDADSVTIEDYGNGWYRLEQTQTCTAAGSAGAVMYSDGAADFYIWGVQSEEGSYATSYIPTYGSAVTRNVDSCSKTGVSSLIGQTEGTFYWEGTLEENPSGANMQFALSDGTTSQQIKFVVSSSSTYVAAEIKNGGVQQFYNNHNIDAKTNRKYAIAYKANDFAFYIDGTQIATDTSGSVPACTKISFDNGVAANNIHGVFNNVILLPTRLSNAELADLTTL